MRDLLSDLDEIDAVLGDEVIVDDLSVLAAVVHDIRSEYQVAEPLRRSDELCAITQPVEVDAAVVPLARRARRRGLQAAGLGLAGKVLLGTTLAAAGVGGLGAADVIELPGLPDQAADQAVEVRPATIEPAATAPEPPVSDASDDEAETDELSGPPAEAPGAAVSEAAHAKADQAGQFVPAMDEWRTCTEGLPVGDRVSTCGERPHPADFGVTDPPGALARPEVGNSSGGVGRPATPGQNRGGNADHPRGPPTDREVGRP